MPWNNEIDLSKRKFTSRLIVERCIARGWKIKGFESNPAIFLIYIPGRGKPTKIFSASPPQMSYPAIKIAKDKYITNWILSEEGLRVPEELLISIDDYDKVTVEEFLKKHKKVVVKPLDASHGKGITVGVDSIEGLNHAIKDAASNTDKSVILIQQYVEGHDIRILCIDYKFADSITRKPAFVVGDGQHTIIELIDIANQSPDRGENYKARLNYIHKQKALDFLGEEKIDQVPLKDEEVRVMGVSNVGMGGERINIKDNIPDFLKEIAENAARALDLPVCGVDFLVSEQPKEDSAPDYLSPYIIEVNECPMLTMYENLDSPEQIEVIDKYLDFISRY